MVALLQVSVSSLLRLTHLSIKLLSPDLAELRIFCAAPVVILLKVLLILFCHDSNSLHGLLFGDSQLHGKDRVPTTTRSKKGLDTILAKGKKPMGLSTTSSH